MHNVSGVDILYTAPWLGGVIDDAMGQAKKGMMMSFECSGLSDSTSIWIFNLYGEHTTPAAVQGDVMNSSDDLTSVLHSRTTRAMQSSIRRKILVVICILDSTIRMILCKLLEGIRPEDIVICSSILLVVRSLVNKRPKLK